MTKVSLHTYTNNSICIRKEYISNINSINNKIIIVRKHGIKR